jgi:DNA-binding transcriptional MerR regulator
MMRKEFKNRIPMRELEKLTEFSRATINFYIREGILPTPHKSARNMAYYDEDFIQKLERIKKLKKSGFSLGQIKQFINAENGVDNAFILQAISSINRLLPAGEGADLITLEQIRAIGFTDATIRELQQMNLITPVNHEGTLFPAYCLTICEFVKYFLGIGIPMTVARNVVQKLVEITRIESEAFINYIRQPMIEKEVSLDEQNLAIQECIEKINTLLPLLHLQILKSPAENLLRPGE